MDYHDDGFDSLVSAFQRSGDTELAKCEPWQLALQPGEAFLSQCGNLLIYNLILPDAPQDDWSARYFAQPHAVRVRAYSEIVPEGEEGAIPRYHAQGVLTPEQMERARVMGWPSAPALFFGVVVADSPTWVFEPIPN